MTAPATSAPAGPRTVPPRERFVAYVRGQLVGPFGGDCEVIADPPNRRYLMGILFPRNVDFKRVRGPGG